MKKVNSVKHDKIWGYEIWMYSPVPGKETKLEDGTITTEGPLVKIIKADQPLSVQVHPDDKMAQAVEHQPNGKSESWVILKSNPGAELVLGLKDFNEQTIRTKINDGSFEDLLLKVKVHPGEFYDIPAGVVHGIGAGLTILEVQQPSDVTYRYFDYNRLENGKPRELHLDKAIMAQKDMSYHLDAILQNPLTYKNKVGSQTFLKKPTYVNEKILVIDLDKYEAYIAENELISLSNYALISL